MHKELSLAVRVAIVAVVATSLTACATVKPEQLAAVDAKATSAMSEARSAVSTANNAMAAATAASEAAAKAQSTADAGMTCCTENKDRIERMFEKTMAK